MAADDERIDAARGGALAHRGGGRRDRLAHTGPLISLWLPMMIVVGLMILVGVTSSHVALAGALVALLIGIYVVVTGTVRLANRPPQEEDDEDPHHSETS